VFPSVRTLTCATPMVADHIGRFIVMARDALARLLLGARLRPNHVTVLGMLCTVGAGVAIAAGRPYWRPWGVSLIVAAGACDILDGAMANLSGLKTRFGGILDSCCDRVGDAALYGGAALYFIVRPDAPAGAAGPPNLTLIVLAGVGLLWAYLISYIRARAEQTVAFCGGGFWQRGERVVTILLGVGFHHVTTAVWILGVWPLATVAHRLWRARRTSPDAAPDAEPIQPRGLLGLVLWRWGRRGIPFDIHTAVPILMLIFWGVPAVDPLRHLVFG